ncbi:Eukaryotic-type carbonic anhydrase, putative [Leishmania shawi]|uniref:carbonic anhydrase n=1 Tax=Leishmania shawi TaxID=5680 RepID=A0ABR3E2K9_9TRYP
MGTHSLCAAFAFVQLVLFLSVAGIVNGLDEQHSSYEGNYGTARLVLGRPDDSGASWNYANLNEWPSLCLTGSRQSPISFTNVNPDEVVTSAPLQRLKFSSACVFPREVTKMRIVNEGAVNTVSFERLGGSPDGLSECTVLDPLNSSRTYHFTGLHFHVMSEHQFRTLRPDAEMHLSFTTNDEKEKTRKTLTVAVMLKASTTSNSTSVRTLRHILVDGSLPMRHAMTTCFLKEDLALTSLIPARESYLLYDGSQTHPPCTENVRWVVMTSPIFISRVSLGRLRDAMDALLPNDFHRFRSARPPQTLNSRHIYRFDDITVPPGGSRRKGKLGDAWSRKKKGSANLSARVRTESMSAGSATDFYEHNNGPLVKPFVSLSSDSGSASGSHTVRLSSPLVLDAAGRNSRPLAPTAVKLDTEAAGSISESDAHESRSDNSEATTNSSSAPQANTSSSVSASSSNVNVSAESSHPSESSAQALSNVSKPQSTTTTTTTTTTTNSPSDPGREKMNASDSSSTADTGLGFGNFLESPVTRAWVFLKTFSINAFQAIVAYAKANPVRVGVSLLCIIALIFLFRTCYRGWRRPVYVVGINPTELQPLNPDNRFEFYGGTVPVRPARASSA